MINKTRKVLYNKNAWEQRNGQQGIVVGQLHCIKQFDRQKKISLYHDDARRERYSARFQMTGLFVLNVCTKLHAKKLYYFFLQLRTNNFRNTVFHNGYGIKNWSDKLFSSKPENLGCDET